MLCPIPVELKIADLIAKQNLNISRECCKKLAILVNIHYKWNSIHNISAHRTIGQVIKKQVGDSLTLVPYLERKNVKTLLDLGSGPGFPGLPIAISCPNLTVTLLDSKKKSLAFAYYACGILKLDNVEIKCIQIEKLVETKVFDFISVRAVSKLKNIIDLSLKFLKNDGQILAMKGSEIEDEVFELKEQYPELIVNAFNSTGELNRKIVKISQISPNEKNNRCS